MPGFNGKGPEGEGPQTGRKMGKCNPNNNVEEGIAFSRGFGNGFKGRRNQGRGMRQAFRFGRGAGNAQ